MPCPKGLTTFGCGATDAAACHKRCVGGSYYDTVAEKCAKCPAGTFWPMTSPVLETDACLPCTSLAGSAKVGQKLCPGVTGKSALKNKTANKRYKPVRV